MNIFTYGLTKEESALIQACRSSKLPPLSVMLGVVADFRKDNVGGKWNELIDTFNAYIDDLMDGLEDDEEYDE